MTELLDVFAQIFRTLWAHKLRSFLTMFGIAWGVASLLLLVGMGEGFRAGNQRGFDELGKDVMFVFPGRAPVVAGSQSSGRWYRLTYQDYLDLLKAPHIRAATPVLQRDDIRSISDYASSNGLVLGVEPQFKGIRYLPLAEGRWLNDLDLSEEHHVAIVGPEIVRNLFPGRPAIGSGLLLNGIRFQIVGVLGTIGRGDNVSENSRIYVPYTTMAKFFPLKWAQQRDALSFINYQPTVREDHELAHAEMRRIIAHNHGLNPQDDDSFEEWDSIRSAEMVGKIFDAMNMFLGSVGLVTLMLGAIGVVNIMLISVTERTREIGLRKALGATNRNILFHFFLEGALLTGLSGFVGLISAWGLMAALSGMPSPMGFDPPRIVPSSAAVAILSLAVAGIVAGLYPARMAALLPPVEALRKE